MSEGEAEEEKEKRQKHTVREREGERAALFGFRRMLGKWEGGGWRKGKSIREREREEDTTRDACVRLHFISRAVAARARAGN